MTSLRDSKYWAHSDRDGLDPGVAGSKWQPLREHLRNVSGLARMLAEYAAPSYTHFHDIAGWCGLLHDYGKYSDCFQDRIRGKPVKCPHAIHGAAMGVTHLRAPHLALAIAGHHAGMPDRSQLLGKTSKASSEAMDLLARSARDLPEIGKLLGGPPPVMENIGGRFDLLTRMSFSCLIDADRLDTSGRVVVQSPLDAANRLGTLRQYVGELSEGSADGVVKATRREVLEDCLRAATFSERILSLSVPTGGGKTLSGMAFALRRAELNPGQYRRIIVVIPYLSIIEQNAEVYANVFGPDALWKNADPDIASKGFELPQEIDAPPGVLKHPGSVGSRWRSSLKRMSVH